MKTTDRDTIYRWISPPDGTEQRLYNVGVLADGTLHNPNGYPPDIVRNAVEAANARRHLRRCEAAKRAGKTRALRREKRVEEAVRRLLAGLGIPHEGIHCWICGKALSDPDSMWRGIGSECWQEVLARVTDKTARDN
jgi:hypothetical protein